MRETFDPESVTWPGWALLFVSPLVAFGVVAFVPVVVWYAAAWVGTIFAVYQLVVRYCRH